MEPTIILYNYKKYNTFVIYIQTKQQKHQYQ